MKRVLAAIIFSVWSISTFAQVNYEAVRVADLIVTDATIQPFKQAFSLEDIRKAGPTGKSDKINKILAEELQRSLTRENLAKGVAQVLTETFTEDELKELDRFLRSPVGRKYLDLGKTLTENPKLFELIIHQTCEAASKRVGAKELSVEECLSM